MSYTNNTLYVTTPGTMLRREHETVVINVKGERRAAVPLHHLGSIVCLGNVLVSPALMGTCAERGIGLSFLSQHGRFLARVEGPISGNVLLRKAQYRLAEDPQATLSLARSFVAGKLVNCRSLLRRAARDTTEQDRIDCLTAAADRLTRTLDALGKANSSLEQVRGYEGEGAAVYYGAFEAMIRKGDGAFTFRSRSRRPPKDPMNALLSFLYTVLSHDASSALAAVGLDPAVGYLHEDRPGRPSLGLDLMEEFRSILADRVALALVNLGQVQAAGFQTMDTGAVLMSDEARKTLLVAYQKKKDEELTHPFTGERTTFGTALLVQARLLARTIRGDLECYPPFAPR